MCLRVFSRAVLWKEESLRDLAGAEPAGHVVGFLEQLSYVQLFETPWTIYIAHQAPLSMHGIFQARILEWIAMSSSMPTEGCGIIFFLVFKL